MGSVRLFLVGSVMIVTTTVFVVWLYLYNPTDERWMIAIYPVGGGFLAGLVGMIAGGAGWLISRHRSRRWRARRRAEPRCPFCGYLLHGLPTRRCPECGRPFDVS